MSADVAISVSEARERINRVRTSVDMLLDDVRALWAGQAWQVLGYESWEDLCDQEFEVRLALPREQRRELVADLTESGLSSRAIGSALGVGIATVTRDRQATVPNGTVDPDARITGLDGKSRPAHVTSTTRTTEATTVEHDVDTDTGEILERPTLLVPLPQPIWTDEELRLRQELEAGNTVVVNMRGDGHPKLWAWAEQSGLAVRIDRKSAWGNPFEMTHDGDRDQVIGKYATYYFPYKPKLIADVGTLRGKALGCWCAPLRCHGDILASVV